MTANSRLVSILAAVVLVVLACIRIESTTRVFTQTYDEHTHILCGLEWLQQNSYRIEPQHPPLSRVAVALLPYLEGYRIPEGTQFGDYNRFNIGTDILHQKHDYANVLHWARLGSLPFFIGGCIVVFFWTRQLFGDLAGFLSLLLFTTASPVLAHSGLATTDAAAMASLAAAIWAYLRWLEAPSRQSTSLLGLAVSVALLSKMSNIPFLALAFLAVTLTEASISGKFTRRASFWKPELRRRATSGLLALVVALFCVWAGYRFSSAHLAGPEGRPHLAVDRITQPLGLPASVSNWLVETPLVPAPEFIFGIRQVVQHSEAGHLSFLLGRTSTFGRWDFFPVVVAVKTPFPLLLLSVVGSVFFLRFGFVKRGGWRPAAIVAACSAIFLFSMTTTINLGIRHLLGLFPLACVIAGGFASRIRSRLVIIALGGLLTWQVIGSFAVHPDYLADFNFLAGSHPENVRVDSDLDWGQGLGRLSKTLREMDIDKIHIAYYGSADLSKHGLPQWEYLEPGVKQTGWIAANVSAIKLFPEDFGWLEDCEPYTLVGKSIRLYHIPEEQP